MKNHLLWFLTFLLCLPVGVQAQKNTVDLSPVTRAFVIKNAFVVQKPGEVLEMGTVLIRDGLIQAVGKDVKIPADAKVLEADSMYVYAGFIEGMSYSGIPKPKEDRDRPRVDDPGNPPNDIAGIQPERNVRDLIDPEDRSVSSMRKLGFTAAHVIPRGGMLPGHSAIVLLGGQSADDMILRNGQALGATFESSRGAYPGTDMAIMATWRNLYRQAEQAKKQGEQYARNPQGVQRPTQDRVLNAFFPVIAGNQSVFFVAESVKEAYRAMTLQKELGFPLVLAELRQAWLIMDELKAKDIPVLLSLDLPESKEKDKADAKEEEPEELEGTAGEQADDKDKQPDDPEKKRLEERRLAEMTKYEAQAGKLAAAGVRFGFSTLEFKEKDFKANLRRMIDNGLTEDQALAALTTHPAAMLGVSQMLGTVEKGKIANLVLSDQPYFAKDAQVRYVFVDGQMFAYDAKKKKKKGDPSAVVDVAGEWSYNIEVPGQQADGTLTLEMVDGEVSGTISNSQSPDVRKISDTSLSGNNLTFSSSFEVGGQSLTLNFDLVISGETFEGSVSVGEFGTFDIEGERVPK